MYSVNDALTEKKIADEISSSVYERGVFVSDYLQSGNERAKQQWIARNVYIDKLLKSASEKFMDAKDKTVVEELLENHKAIGKLFSGIVDYREKQISNPDNAALYQETENRLRTQLAMKRYETMEDARILQESANRYISFTLQRAGWSILFVIVFVTVAIIINLWLMGRMITNRIGLLRDGALVIGEGNLDHRIDIKGDDELADFAGVFNNMTEKRKLAEESIRKLNEDLVARNEELEFTNKEMESFIYSISHDLRGPLRAISGFSSMLFQGSADDCLDDKRKNYLNRIQLGAAKMSRLIDDLLRLSNISRQEMRQTEVNLSNVAETIIAELRESNPDRKVHIQIKEDISAFADLGLIKIVLSNLLGNAWKFTSKTENAQIDFATVDEGGRIVYYVKDNGAGFNQEYADKMFLPFHRLHQSEEFEGTGIGLAIVERIIRRHGGKIWAEGEEDKGAIVNFTLD
jgi:signal transduction histidine kinase